VDYIIHYHNEEMLYKLLQDIQPNIRILGSDWQNKQYTGHELAIPIHWHNRNHDYSTSNLRNGCFKMKKTEKVLSFILIKLFLKVLSFQFYFD
tara:strand:+ start:2093 stop:2371 length:279 start_codon:yes stop_codon:yes gene_type:complete